jgi:hypothetical protein
MMKKEKLFPCTLIVAVVNGQGIPVNRGASLVNECWGLTRSFHPPASLGERNSTNPLLFGVLLVICDYKSGEWGITADG